jgi:hypothetical protein
LRTEERAGRSRSRSISSAKNERAAVRWHARFAQEVPHLDLRESLTVLTLLAAIPTNRLAAAALAELLSRRRSCERIAEALVRWSRAT